MSLLVQCPVAEVTYFTIKKQSMRVSAYVYLLVHIYLSIYIYKYLYVYIYLLVQVHACIHVPCADNDACSDSLDVQIQMGDLIDISVSNL